MSKVRVKVSVYLTLREVLGWKEKVIELDDNEPKFKDLIEAIPKLKEVIKKYHEKGWGLIVLVNGRHLELLGGMNTVLRDGDEVSIFPPAAGG